MTPAVAEALRVEARIVLHRADAYDHEWPDMMLDEAARLARTMTPGERAAVVSATPTDCGPAAVEWARGVLA